MAMHNPKGRVNYEPNSWGSGPRESPTLGFRSVPEEVRGPKLRVRAELFADHYSQARQFYISQTEIEQTHIKDAFVFELSKVETPAIRARMVSHLLNVDEALAKKVAEGLGMKDLPTAAEPARPVKKDLPSSPALSIISNVPEDFTPIKPSTAVRCQTGLRMPLRCSRPNPVRTSRPFTIGRWLSSTARTGWPGSISPGRNWSCFARSPPPQAGEAEPVFSCFGEFPLRFGRFRPRELEEMRRRDEALTFGEPSTLGAEVDDRRSLRPRRRKTPPQLHKFDPLLTPAENRCGLGRQDVVSGFQIGGGFREYYGRADLAEGLHIGAVGHIISKVVAHL